MNKKLRIAIIGSRGYPYVYSGYETLVKELSERLVKKGHTVRVYCHRNLFEKKPKNVNGIELIYTPSIKSKVLSQLYNSFFSFLHVCISDSDVILIVNSANGPFGIFTKLFRKKTCINVDGLEWLRPKWKGLGAIYFRISSKLSTIFFDKIITDSEEMNLIYKTMFNKDSTVIAYGPTMFKTSSKDILKKFDLNKGEYYLIVGRLIPDNNSDLILKGYLKSRSTKKIVVVGDVPYNDSFSNNIKKLASGNIIFTGYIKCKEELSQLYTNCFGYIHGHEFGGTNPTMINALDLNCEIIALDTIFNREMLKGKNAILFKKNIKNISSKINYFEKNIKEFKILNKDYLMPKEYTWSYVAENYCKLFQTIIQKGK